MYKLVVVNIHSDVSFVLNLDTTTSDMWSISLKKIKTSFNFVFDWKSKDKNIINCLYVWYQQQHQIVLHKMSFSKFRRASGRLWGNLRGHKPQEDGISDCPSEQQNSRFQSLKKLILNMIEFS